MQSCGVLYIATGASYLEEARRSAQSVKKHSPTLSIGVVTDQSIQPDADFDIVLDVSANTVLEEHQERYLTQDKVPYYRKILPLFQSPFQKTIFLDSDTFVAAPLDELFTLLDHFDLLVTPAHIVHDYRFEREEPPFSQIPAAFGYFNTGLIAFRKSPASDAVLHRWLDASPGTPYETLLDALETSLLRRLLDRHQGKVTHLANDTRLNRATLRQKLRRLGLHRDDPTTDS